MDPGPQVPTNVTGMLKFGTNLLQAVGQFNGRYVVLVAYMSFTPLPEDPVLQDYLQPTVTSVDSDSDIIEGASQISLNCPIRSR
ncbi:E4 SUMO-protein ligase PIAL2-like [Glycine soja]|uniref:E4 SUMO-protein ligase PIAL2-like n=1 Tax=Glycine soja TaxID=3848 RepID=UPI0010400A0D|nr:E4 SUMO-protein ligase PIAL2-like [Glycine soja]